MKFIYRFFLILVTPLFLTFCGDQDAITAPDPIPKNGRLIGMDMADRTSSGDFIADITSATNMGINFTSLHLPWTLIETNSGSGTNSGTLTDPYAALSSYNTVCSTYNIKLSLTIRPVDLTGKTVPGDLSTMRFTNQILISRFCSMLEYVFSIFNYQQLTSVQIGNEIDHYDPASDSDSEFWNDYPVFLVAVRTWLTNRYPGIKTGFTITFSGATGSEQNRYKQWADQMDLVGITYYLMEGSSFQVKDPAAVQVDFTTICTAFPGIPIYIQEAGCQTAVACGGSQSVQASFIRNLFTAWDSHRETIPLINMIRLNDYSPDHATNIAGDYGLGDFSFIEYLRTLGITTYDGHRKSGFITLSNQLLLRGW